MADASIDSRMRELEFINKDQSRTLAVQGETLASLQKGQAETLLLAHQIKTAISGDDTMGITGLNGRIDENKKNINSHEKRIGSLENDRAKVILIGSGMSVLIGVVWKWIADNWTHH